VARLAIFSSESYPLTQQVSEQRYAQIKAPGKLISSEINPVIVGPSIKKQKI
jgi:hypothetical protein